MNTDDIIDQAREVIAATFGLSAVDVPDSLSTDSLTQWDSLHHLTLIVALEDRFSVTYTSAEIPHMNSLEAIAQTTARHLQFDAAR